MKNNEFKNIDELLAQDSQSINSPSEFKEMFFEEDGTIKSGIIRNYQPYLAYFFIAASLISIGLFQFLNLESNSNPETLAVNNEIAIENNIEKNSKNNLNNTLINNETNEVLVEKSNENISNNEKNTTQKTSNNAKSKKNIIKEEILKKLDINNNIEIGKSNYEPLALDLNNNSNNEINLNIINSIKSDSKSNLSDFSISVRGFNNISSVNTDLNNINAWNNNLNIHFDFYRYKNVVFGAGFGRENLPQQYSGNLNNENVHVTQNPNIYWLSLNARYYPDLLSYKSLSTFIEGGIGLTPYGSMLRSNIGLEYDFWNNTSLFIAADLSNYSYSYQNNVFFTNKIGLTYGIRVKL